MSLPSCISLPPFLFLSSLGPPQAQRRGLEGLASRNVASCHGSPRWEVRTPSLAVTSRHTAHFVAAPIPRVHSGATQPLAIPALRLPAMRSRGGVLETPLQIGWGLPQLAWEWPREREGGDDNHLVCPTHRSLS